MKLTLLIILIMLVSCAPTCETKIDQTLRAKLFQECLKVVPAGPLATKYNDWDEVVDSCGSQAYYQSQYGCNAVMEGKK